jgi:hypothetical protein
VREPFGGLPVLAALSYAVFWTAVFRLRLRNYRSLWGLEHASFLVFSYGRVQEVDAMTGRPGISRLGWDRVFSVGILAYNDLFWHYICL